MHTFVLIRYAYKLDATEQLPPPERGVLTMGLSQLLFHPALLQLEGQKKEKEDREKEGRREQRSHMKTEFSLHIIIIPTQLIYFARTLASSTLFSLVESYRQTQEIKSQSIHLNHSASP